MTRSRLLSASVVLIAALSGAVGPATAQEVTLPATPVSESVTTTTTNQGAGAVGSLLFGATLETFYQFNWNRPPDRTLALRAYDTRSNTFAIQQATVLAELPPDIEADRRFGARLDLQFGLATEAVQGSAANEPRPDVYRHVWQAFGSYVFDVGAGLRLDAGKFASMLGYETNYAKDNQAFSRAYLFNFLPFYHSGVRLTYSVNDRVTFLYMLTNGIQQTEDFNNFKSNHVAAIIRPSPRVTWTTNLYAGQEQPDGGEPDGPDGWFRVVDTYLTVTPTDRWSVGIDVNRTTNELTPGGDRLSLTGLGAYARYQATSSTGFGVRYERLDDEGLFGGVVQQLSEITLTAEQKLSDGFFVRAEFRRDWSNRPFFTGRGGQGDLRRHQNTALLGGVWVFGNKPGTW